MKPIVDINRQANLALFQFRVIVRVEDKGVKALFEIESKIYTLWLYVRQFIHEYLYDPPQVNFRQNNARYLGSFHIGGLVGSSLLLCIGSLIDVKPF